MVSIYQRGITTAVRLMSIFSKTKMLEMEDKNVIGNAGTISVSDQGKWHGNYG